MAGAPDPPSGVRPLLAGWPPLPGPAPKPRRGERVRRAAIVTWRRLPPRGSLGRAASTTTAAHEPHGERDDLVDGDHDDDDRAAEVDADEAVVGDAAPVRLD